MEDSRSARQSAVFNIRVVSTWNILEEEEVLNSTWTKALGEVRMRTCLAELGGSMNEIFAMGFPFW